MHSGVQEIFSKPYLYHVKLLCLPIISFGMKAPMKKKIETIVYNNSSLITSYWELYQFDHLLFLPEIQLNRILYINHFQFPLN